jgi:hypothetical protein
VNDLPSPNTPVFGPITLAPGEAAPYTGSFIVPMDICDTNIVSTVTARGNNLCNGVVVTGSSSSACPIQPAPRLVVTKNCPANPVPPGGVFTFSGMVSNAGNITLTNVIVVNDQPTNNTPVLGPITLVPGQFTNFSGSYVICTLCCPPYVDTISATGAQICDGSNVSATATVYCPGISSPQLDIDVACPEPPPLLGQPLVYSGTVSNAGDIVLVDVFVTDNQVGFITEIFALAPGETEEFVGAYLPVNCCSNVVTVTATAFDACSGIDVSNVVSAPCTVTCPTNQPQLLMLTNPAVKGQQFQFSFATEQCKDYTVQYTDVLVPPNWQPLTNFIGCGSIVTIFDTTTSSQKFYRVLVQ